MERLSNGGLTSKNGFSVVAPMRVTRPVSTPGSSASCCDFENRWTSSRNRIVPCPRSPRRWRARSSTSRTSFTPALTALSCSKALLVWAAMAWARVVLPVPGGPQRITDERRSASTSVRSGWPAPNSCSCPTMSSSVRGRRRAARGALAANESSAAEENRSSGIPPTVPHPPTQPTHNPLQCLSAPPPRPSPPQPPPHQTPSVCVQRRNAVLSAHRWRLGGRVRGICMAIEHVAKLDALVQVQHGLVTSDQAIEVLGPSRKQRWVAERRLLSVQPGVLRMAGAPETWHQSLMAAQLSSGAIVSHRSAAELWGLIPPAGYVDISVRPPDQPRLRPPAIAHRIRDLHPELAIERGGDAHHRSRPHDHRSRARVAVWSVQRALSRGISTACPQDRRREAAARRAGPEGSQRHGRDPRAPGGTPAHRSAGGEPPREAAC